MLRLYKLYRGDGFNTFSLNLHIPTKFCRNPQIQEGKVKASPRYTKSYGSRSVSVQNCWHITPIVKNLKRFNMNNLDFSFVNLLCSSTLVSFGCWHVQETNICEILREEETKLDEHSNRVCFNIVKSSNMYVVNTEVI